MGVTQGSELGLDQIALDVGLQRDEQQRVDREYAAEQADRKGVLRIFPRQRGRERDEGLPHQENGVQPHHPVVRIARHRQQVMVVEPELADDDEADEPAHELGQQLEQLVSKLTHARMFLERRHLQLEDEQCHHDGEDAVAEGFDAAQPQLPLRETVQKTHSRAPAPSRARLRRSRNTHRKISRARALHRLRHGCERSRRRDETACPVSGESERLEGLVAKLVGIALAVAGQIEDPLGDDLLDDVGLSGSFERAARLVHGGTHRGSRIGLEIYVLGVEKRQMVRHRAPLELGRRRTTRRPSPRHFTSV